MKNRENRAKQGQGHPQVSAKLARGSVTFFWGGVLLRGIIVRRVLAVIACSQFFFYSMNFPAASLK